MSRLETAAPAARSGVFPDDVPAGSIPLVCLPPSGAGASYYRPWRRLFADEFAVYPVLLPARESRFTEEPLDSMDSVVEQVLPAIGALAAGTRFALFGHSMGALIAYELARVLDAAGTPPMRLLVSGCTAPHVPRSIERLSDRPVAEMAEVLSALGGLPLEDLRHPGLLELIEPGLRGDLRVVESYAHRPGPPLSCPITALRGTADPLTTAPGVDAWSEYTTADCRSYAFSGGHAFPQQRTAEVVRRIVHDLTLAAVPAREQAPARSRTRQDPGTKDLT